MAFVNPYICPTCGKTYYCHPDDPAAGSMCETCAQKAYDEAPSIPLSEERIQEIVDYVTRACIKCSKPQCQCIELSMGIPPEAYQEACKHEHLNMDGIRHSCGADCRGSN